MWRARGCNVSLIWQLEGLRSLLINGYFLREVDKKCSRFNDFVVFSGSTGYRIWQRDVDEEQPVACLNFKSELLDGALLTRSNTFSRSLLLQNLLLMRP